MKYLSVCAGIEAATVAWHPLAWQPLAFSEIEKFPNALLQHHYPDVPNLGDMSKFRDWDEDLLADVDLVVGGTPCQAFSIAGLRGGLEDERGNLTLIFIHLVEHINAIRLIRGKPGVIVLWENVPGVLSDSTGAFGSLLGGLASEDDAFAVEKWPSSGVVDGTSRRVAWAVLDAQYFGVPQRRRRVFALALPVGDSGNGIDPAEVLSIGKSLCRHPTPIREKGKSIAPTVRAGASNSGPGHGARSGDSKDELIVPEIAATLGASPSTSSQPTVGDGRGTVIPEWPAEVASTMNTAFAKKYGYEDQHALGGASYFVLASGQANAPVGEDISPSLTCLHEAPIVGPLTAKGPQAMGAPEVDAEHYLPICVTQDSTPVVSDISPPLKVGTGLDLGQPPAVAFAQNQRDEVRLMDKAGALAANPGAKQQTYVFKPGQGKNARSDGISEHVSPTLSADQGGNAVPGVATGFCTDQRGHGDGDISPTLNAKTTDNDFRPMLAQDMAVRRLTPMECERLQGFPDNYTNIPGASDSGRYKALGNSMAVPVMHWLGQRIDEAHK